MKNLKETLEQIRTWCVMAGDPRAVMAALQPARAFPRMFFVDLLMGEALAGDRAPQRSPEDVLSMVVANTNPGDLVVTHGSPAMGVAFACARLGRRALLVLQPGPAEEAKQALRPVPWVVPVGAPAPAEVHK